MYIQQITKYHFCVGPVKGLKGDIRDCSISAIIGANYIWRHRVKNTATLIVSDT